MVSKLKPVAHDDRLSLIEHLDELRTRIIVCVLAFVAAMAVCVWQDDVVLDTINRPLTEATDRSCGDTSDPFQKTYCWQRAVQGTLGDLGSAASALAAQARAEENPRLQAAAEKLASSAEAARRATPEDTSKRPVTLGVGEPFTATFRVAAYAGLLIAMPLLLYQLYAFVLPAFSPRERKVALPLMAMVPFLFVSGVVFAYLLVLPAAIGFLQNFNADSYDILIQARDYYKFAITTMGLMGLLFQMPIGILAVTRLGIVTTEQLRKNRRYAILVIAVVAMAMPGQDPVTMLSMMVPMLVLYEVSILMASILDRRRAKRLAEEESELDAYTSSP